MKGNLVFIISSAKKNVNELGKIHQHTKQQSV